MEFYWGIKFKIFESWRTRPKIRTLENYFKNGNLEIFFFLKKRSLGKLNFQEPKFYKLNLKLNFKKALRKWFFI